MPFSLTNPLLTNRLVSLLKAFPQVDYPVHSRVHPLKSAPNLYVKREDELGFGISGSKIRKYRSLIPYFLSKNIKQVVIIGGVNSNHVLGICQLLIENEIKPILFLRGDKELTPQKKQELGNVFFLQFFINLDSVTWMSKNEYQNAFEIASKAHPGVFILEEGGMAKAALPGLLSLSLDILKNEEDLNINFEQVFIDAGTGLTAIALLLGFAFLKKKTKIHIFLLADTKEIFLEKLKTWHQIFEELLECTCPFPTEFILHYPENGKSFGSTNKKVFDEIRSIAKTEGFLTDPIYSSKLFLESKKILASSPFLGKSIIIHSGGALTLTGFHNKLLQK